MSPQNARVFIVEDDSRWQNVYQNNLFVDSGHTIVEFATTMDKAVEVIPKLTEMGIQVAIIDGNISPHSHYGDEGKYLIHEIKRLHPQIKTIGMSGMFNLGADIDLGKESANKLIKTITEL